MLGFLCPKKSKFLRWLISFLIAGTFAISSSQGFASFRLAKEAYDKNDYKSAFSWCNRSFHKVDNQCENLLGILYFNGFGVTKDVPLALEYFKKSANSGNKLAQFTLASFYFKGEHGLPKDYRRAFELMLASAKQGYALAQLLVGTFYENGEGVERDLNTAIDWWEKVLRQKADDPMTRKAQEGARQALANAAPRRKEIPKEPPKKDQFADYERRLKELRMVCYAPNGVLEFRYDGSILYQNGIPYKVDGDAVAKQDGKNLFKITMLGEFYVDFERKRLLIDVLGTSRNVNCL